MDKRRKHGVDPENNVPKEVFEEKLRYCKKTGKLFWKGNSRNSGKEAGGLRTNRTGGVYCVVGIGHEGAIYKLFAHRIIWMLTYDYWPTELDHINGLGSDNRLENLREVSRSENNKNHRRQSNNSSGIAGVTFINKRNMWRAYGNAEGRQIHLKITSDFFEACCARKSWESLNGFSYRHGK